MAARREAWREVEGGGGRDRREEQDDEREGCQLPFKALDAIALPPDVSMYYPPEQRTRIARHPYTPSHVPVRAS